MDGVACAIDVGCSLGFGRGADVVNRGKVAEVLDLALQVRHGCLIHAQQGLGQVALYRNQALAVLAHALLQLFELVHGSGAGQHVDIALAVLQLVDEVAADEAGAAGDEVRHIYSLL